MLEDVISALAGVRTLAGIAVVTIDPDAIEIGRRYGATILTEGARDGHTGAVTAAARHLGREGSGGLLAVSGDIPLITSSEISSLLAAHPFGKAFSIVPARGERGSNAILMTPPDAVPLSFGEDSFLRHVAAARLYGIEPRILHLPGIGLDIDHPEDLALFMRKPSPTRAWAFVAEAGLVEPFQAKTRSKAELVQE
jgi:2-phospho-L-lactate guanylyltransferase